MLNTGPSRLTEEEVLFSFSVEAMHDRAMLEHYLALYPEHADALLACAMELMHNAACDDAVSPVSSSEVVDQAWRQFGGAMSVVPTASVLNPFSKLSPTAFKAMVKRLDISNLFLMRLRDRMIDVTTMPERFLQYLADELGTTRNLLVDYLRNPPTTASGQMLRSGAAVPPLETLTYDQAVATSQLKSDQQAKFRSMRD